ncbi:cysteine-rich CWC family protein [Paenibacillus thermoaerophilus]|uniref:Cysteine-rich CWC family protein n=1 Tax=Paenibacillus thermoaerophilus TaxID=1215385 RepID=A0ABW2V4N5_9BACL|nr:cysteine-rich CWC family protein [Paenibacillus thermoaerophilus]TMV07345.1 cysteine-rich CWC family protein [Paenibacillus thermoaerophilus]
MSEPRYTNTRLCPLCGQDNRCGYEAGLPIEACWCYRSGPIPGELRARVPEEKRGSCICEACLEQFRREHEDH